MSDQLNSPDAGPAIRVSGLSKYYGPFVALRDVSFDISADLQELAQTSVAVVCAGVKSILDIGLTLEYLETHGVPVVNSSAMSVEEIAAVIMQTRRLTDVG